MWYDKSMHKEKVYKLNDLRKEIQWTQILLIVFVTLLLSMGGLLINVSANNKAFNQNLQNTAELITKVFQYNKDASREQIQKVFDGLTNELTDVDVISIVYKDNTRIYHTNHRLIGVKYDGTIPDFEEHKKGFYTEDNSGPSGPQRRTYSAIYNEDGSYYGFLMTIMLKTTIHSATVKTVSWFLLVTFAAVIVELLICGTLFNKVKKDFGEFSSDLEGNKYLVDSMRTNNGNFSEQLELVHSIDNAALAAMILEKIEKAKEKNVRFIVKNGSVYNPKDISLSTDSLVTIASNLIDNAIEAINEKVDETSFTENINELSFGIVSKPGSFVMTIDDTGNGISDENIKHIYENGFTTKEGAKGSGLFKTKQLVESLGGKIMVFSTEGAGTSFMVMFGRKTDSTSQQETT